MSCSPSPPTDALHVEDVWLSETVLALARGVATDLGFDRLPILADALEDAGCDNFTLLNHLRSDELHQPNCWAFRPLLRTTLLLPGQVPVTFEYCPPGSFLMGSPESEDRGDSSSEAERQHPVMLTRGFFIAVHPVTQHQWRAVMGTNPSAFTGETLPVECVSWNDAQDFCVRAEGLTGTPLRLPTEAEWEYAARGGTTTAFYWGDVQDGTRGKFRIPSRTFYPGRYREQTEPVGSYAAANPHPWCLTDMHGNVAEWCADGYEYGFYARSPEVDPVCRNESVQTAHSLRGGSWEEEAVYCRSAARSWGIANARYNTIGFRVVFNAT